MRRVEIAALGEVRLIEVETPTPVAGEVLVRTRRVGICGSDLHALAGTHPFIDLPYFPGHEVVGTVEGLGPDASGFNVGDRVLVEPNLVCGQCGPCRSGRYNLCLKLKVFGCQTPGAMADFFTIPTGRLHAVPEALSDEEAALVEPLSTAMHATGLAGEIRGRKVVILGAGPIGLLTLAVAIRAGASDVTVTDLVESKRRRAERIGATRTYDGADPNVPALLRGRFDGPADLVFDCVSSQASVEQAVGIALNGGKVVVIGVARGSALLPLHLLQDREVALQGSAMYVGTDVRAAIALMESHALPTAEIVTSTFELADAQRAFAVATDPDQAKVHLFVAPTSAAGPAA